MSVGGAAAGVEFWMADFGQKEGGRKGEGRSARTIEGGVEEKSARSTALLYYTPAQNGRKERMKE